MRTGPSVRHGWDSNLYVWMGSKDTVRGESHFPFSEGNEF